MVPPDAFRFAEYPTPEVTAVNPVVVMVSAVCTAGVIVTTAVADLVGSATLVAFTVAFEVVVTEGALYEPLVLIAPREVVHVTPTFEVLLTVAVN